MEETCQDRHEPRYGTRWACVRDKGHDGPHGGPAVAWTGRRQPDPASWPREAGDGAAVPAAALVELIRAVVSDRRMTDAGKVREVHALLAGNAAAPAGEEDCR